jgi:hypothetical protein
MSPTALISLALLVAVAASGCELEVEGDATLAVDNRSSADGLEIALDPIDADEPGISDGATFDGGERVTLQASVGLYQLSVIDTAGDGCVIRRFAFTLGDELSAEIFDADLADCAAALPPPDDPDPAWD